MRTVTRSERKTEGSMPHNTLADKLRTMDYGPAPEDPLLAQAWLDQFKRRFGHFIGGSWSAPAERQYFETCDPSTGEKIADIAQGTAADVQAAVNVDSIGLKYTPGAAAPSGAFKQLVTAVVKKVYQESLDGIGR